MPTISDYVKQLNELKMKSLEEYNQAMANYKENYPDFYQQLVQAMETGGKQSTQGKLKDFAITYKWYLLAIGIGIGVIIYLLYLLLVG